MNRYRDYYPHDTAPLKDGDGQFLGVEERLDADIVPAGRVTSATNCRFRSGRVETRKGITILRCLKATGAYPFTATKTANIFPISPPNAYQDWVGTVGVFAPNGVNDVIVGCYLSEIQTLKSVVVTLMSWGVPIHYWKTNDGAYDPVGVVLAGALMNPAYAADLAVTGQDFQFACDLTYLAAAPFNYNIENTGYSFGLIITVTLSDDTVITGYTDYTPYTP